MITAGTFLRGRLHIGTDTRIAGGRAGDPPAIHLAEQLDALGLRSARFKTGTPPRIDGRSVDFHVLERQESEIEQFDYSWSHFWEHAAVATAASTRHPPQLPVLDHLRGRRGEADHQGQHCEVGDVWWGDRFARTTLLSERRRQDRAVPRRRSGISSFSSPRDTIRRSCM